MNPSTNPALALVLKSALLWSDMVKQADVQLSVHGISFSEFCILHQLATAPQQRLSRIELAKAVGLSASGITRLLQPMEKIQLVEKEQNARDARISLVKLSDGGLQIYQDALQSLGFFASQFMSPLTTKQLETLTDLLTRL
ncbi:MarR family winged helix-turn-helix transcriptional regulator [Rheinheimera sp. 4Y26]|uniref:MarR family winged helix-turn-helix transcriptional regulator n=1 Tax=Rheinheimera sp. 4Y26 TaxID=2977811 RepID=UPI0021B13386|nr:MarR family transcriptional regulator [Rheinheimera sp. 4Y26]MCT6698058.1 MarR family transcriptional regulator [Rheinheimera sp. 4Y26]